MNADRHARILALWAEMGRYLGTDRARFLRTELEREYDGAQSDMRAFAFGQGYEVGFAVGHVEGLDEAARHFTAPPPEVVEVMAEAQASPVAAAADASQPVEPGFWERIGRFLGLPTDSQLFQALDQDLLDGRARHH